MIFASGFRKPLGMVAFTGGLRKLSTNSQNRRKTFPTEVFLAVIITAGKSFFTGRFFNFFRRFFHRRKKLKLL